MGLQKVEHNWATFTFTSKLHYCHPSAAEPQLLQLSPNWCPYFYSPLSSIPKTEASFKHVSQTMSVLCSTSSISPRVKAKVLKMSSLGFPVQPSPMHSLCSSLTGLLSRLPRGLCTSFSLWLKGSLPFCHFRSQLKKWALQREQPGNPVQLCLKPSNISCPPALLHLPWGPLFLSDLLSVLPTFFFITNTLLLHSHPCTLTPHTQV